MGKLFLLSPPAYSFFKRICSVRRGGPPTSNLFKNLLFHFQNFGSHNYGNDAIFPNFFFWGGEGERVVIKRPLTSSLFLFPGRRRRFVSCHPEKEMLLKTFALLLLLLAPLPPPHLPFSRLLNGHDS